jgi:hypothetical protein
MHNFWFNIRRLKTTYVITLLLWALGASYCLMNSDAIKDLCRPDILADGAWMVSKCLIVMFFMTIVHQLLIFRSLHELDHNSTLKEEFKGFLNSPCEWTVRFAAVLLLMCAGGELPNLVAQIVGFKTHSIAIMLYPAFSCGLFLALLIWDFMWLRRQKRNPKPFSGRSDDSFFFSDLSGFLNWGLLCVAIYVPNVHAATLALFTLLLLGFYGAILVPRVINELIRPVRAMLNISVPAR